jgi:hypothetical protein
MVRPLMQIRRQISYCNPPAGGPFKASVGLSGMVLLADTVFRLCVRAFMQSIRIQFHVCFHARYVMEKTRDTILLTLRPSTAPKATSGARNNMRLDRDRYFTLHPFPHLNDRIHAGRGIESTSRLRKSLFKKSTGVAGCGKTLVFEGYRLQSVRK